MGHPRNLKRMNRINVNLGVMSHPKPNWVTGVTILGHPLNSGDQKIGLRQTCKKSYCDACEARERLLSWLGRQAKDSRPLRAERRKRQSEAGAKKSLQVVRRFAKVDDVPWM